MRALKQTALMFNRFHFDRPVSAQVHADKQALQYTQRSYKLYQGSVGILGGCAFTFTCRPMQALAILLSCDISSV